MRKVTLTTLVCSLLLLIVAAPASAVIELAPCQEVSAWVEENPNALPTNLAEFQGVPEGYETGVFQALPVDLRNELWTDFLNDFVAAQPQIEPQTAQTILAFRDAFETPGALAELDEASSQLFKNLLSSFTLRLMDPVADLVVEEEQLNQVAAQCNCNPSYDPGCNFEFCTFTQSGCGPNALEPCTGRF